MPNRPAAALMLRPGDREELKKWTCSDRYGVSAATSGATKAYTYQFSRYGVPVLTENSGGNGVPQNPYLFKSGIQDRVTGWVKQRISAGGGRGTAL